MIISVSRRTDIVALYSQWFIKQIERGYCIVENPYNPNQKSLVSLKPEDVDFIVFWTRYPEPILPYLKKLDYSGYKYYFMVTINNYPKEFESFSPKIEKVIESVKKLSKIVGKNRVLWRYDPIILTSATNENWHLKNFESLLNEINKHVRKIIVSLVDKYRKNTKFLNYINKKYGLLSPSEKFGFELSKIAKSYKTKIQSCAEEKKLFPIKNGACIDPKILNIKKEFKKDINQRHQCLCVKSRDIGKYDTCIFKCNYCYASNYKKALKYYINYRLSGRHTSASESSSSGSSSESSG
jgi:DNA repair photolyase